MIVICFRRFRKFKNSTYLLAVKVLPVILWPFSALYAAVMRLRAWAYRRGWMSVHRMEVPVISVGNITIGGTGKTPMAAFLLEYLLSKGLRPGYLSRGYGRSSQGYLLVDRADREGLRYGDEAMLTAQRFPGIPVVVCEDRVLGARRLIAEHGVQVIVLDDAFQHLRIGRQLDLVMIDGTRPPLQDHVLPAGRLREPLQALRRADAFLLGKMPPGAHAERLLGEMSRRFPKALLCQFELKQMQVVPFSPAKAGLAFPMEGLAGKEAIAFSGLGNNAYFKDQLLQSGLRLLDFIGFPDHHRYTEAEYLKILDRFRRHTEINGKFGAVVILTTEKDYHRLISCSWFDLAQDIPIHFVSVEMVAVSGWEALREKIDDLF